MADFLICYDIKNQKRLAKFAKKLEKFAIRVEYSIFFAPNFSKDEMTEIAIELNKILEDEDDVRIYEIEDYGIALGRADLLDEIFVLR